MGREFIRGFFLILLTTIFTSIGQMFFNFASDDFAFNIQGIIFNPNLWFGAIIYGLGIIVLIFGLREGEFTSLFPVLSLSYIWVIVISAIVFQEPITFLKIIGTIVIAAGVSIITLHSKVNRVKQNG